MKLEERKQKIVEAVEDFVKHGIVREGEGLNKINDFADLVMQATTDELREIEVSFDRNEREHFLWACGHCLSMDSFLNIVRMIATRWAGEEVSAAADELNSASSKIVELSRSVEKLEKERVELIEEVQAMEARAMSAESERDQYKNMYESLLKERIRVKLDNGEQLSPSECAFVKELI